jgi:hypothetical protein
VFITVIFLTKFYLLFQNSNLFETFTAEMKIGKIDTLSSLTLTDDPSSHRVSFPSPTIPVEKSDSEREAGEREVRPTRREPENFGLT